MASNWAVLIVCSAPRLREDLATRIARCRLGPVSCGTLSDARKLLSRCEFQLVFCEDVLPDGTSDELLTEASRLKGAPPIVVISRLGDWDAYLSALGLGAFDYIGWPGIPGEIERIAQSAFAKVLHAAAWVQPAL